MGHVVIAFAGLVACMATAILYDVSKDIKLIKATSRELSSILLFGIFLAYISIFFFLVKPEKWSCLFSRTGFNISVSLIYSPLMVKTNRIYRIFSAGRRGVKRPGFVSSSVTVTGKRLV